MIRCSEATKRDIEIDIMLDNSTTVPKRTHFWQQLLKDVVIDNTVKRGYIICGNATEVL